ncbi:MAG: hypothetical protein PHV82_02835 [Victivallaceae bacterium]|nr:hypothetical protein [Victivallaceae bacterium]
METRGLSDGGRSIIMETIKKYKSDKTIMFSDYEILAKAISDIPAMKYMPAEEKRQTVENYGSFLEVSEKLNME